MEAALMSNIHCNTNYCWYYRLSVCFKETWQFAAVKWGNYNSYQTPHLTKQHIGRDDSRMYHWLLKKSLPGFLISQPHPLTVMYFMSTSCFYFVLFPIRVSEVWNDWHEQHTINAWRILLYSIGTVQGDALLLPKWRTGKSHTEYCLCLSTLCLCWTATELRKWQCNLTSSHEVNRLTVYPL